MKALESESAELDFSRYGDTLFEILFTGGRLKGGSVEIDYGESPLATNVFACADAASIKPYVTAFQHILRRRPFLVKNLENTLRRLLQSIEHHEQAERDTIASALSQVFIQKLGVPPENMFSVLLNDALVARGSVLAFLTIFARGFLAESTIEELMSVLKRGKVDGRLLEFFPQQRRTSAAFVEHFSAEGLEPLVSWWRKRYTDTRLKELKEAVGEAFVEGAPVQEVVDMVKAKRKDGALPDSELAGCLWDALLATLDTVGKNQQQVSNAVVRALRQWAKVLAVPVNTPKLEMELMYAIQTSCYDDPALIKAGSPTAFRLRWLAPLLWPSPSGRGQPPRPWRPCLPCSHASAPRGRTAQVFPDAVRNLYDKDVLSEETVLSWYKRGTNPKGRSVFVADLEKFVHWLEEAEEEEDDAA